ncbi:MAG: hypothetical protein PHD02_02045 [Bacilli bacterium]|nr:hypothetical protein [Bacilli bacterium]
MEKKKKVIKKNSNSLKKKTAGKKKTVKKSSVKKKIQKQVIQFVRIKTPENKFNFKFLIFLMFLTGVLLIFSSYAWLSASLNVKVKFFDLVVSSDSGLFISLDGITYSDSVELNADTVVRDLKATYPNNTNQWPLGGLWPVSSNGLYSSNSEKFSVFIGEVVKKRGSVITSKKYLNTALGDEKVSSTTNKYMAFDLFLKNVSGSPYSDNLYIDDGTGVDFAEDVDEDIKEDLRGVLNSIRFGIVKISSTSSKSDINTIQNLSCNNNCQMVIYEPNDKDHSNISIAKAKELDINLVDGEYYPTYGVIKEGTYLEMANGQDGSGIALDTEHFSLQNTIKYADLVNPIFDIPSGVTKFRVYVWLEGQDVDSLATTSKGASIILALNFLKDLAGYE